MSALIIVCILAGIVGLRMIYLYGEPERWLRLYEHEAEQYAIAVLSGSEIQTPMALTNQYIESSRNWVSFCTPTGPLYSKGMAYSLDGIRPANGLGGEPVVRTWRHIRGNWYSWNAD